MASEIFFKVFIKKINYIRSDKNENLNISTLHKEKNANTLSSIISFYEFSYFEIFA